MFGLFSFERFGVPSPFDPAFHYVTSPILSPLVLAVVRLAIAAYALVAFFVAIPLDPKRHVYFSYFTNLNYFGLGAYFAVAGYHTLTFARHGRKTYPLQTWSRFLQLLHVLLQTTIIVFPFVVSLVYWTLLRKPFKTTFDAWSDATKHVSNVVFALFEILLTHSEPAPWMHLVILIAILVCYVGVAYITHARQGVYTYNFFNPAIGNWKVAAYILGIMFGCCAFFGIVKGVCTLRRRICLRREQYENCAGGEWHDLERRYDDRR